MSHTTWLHSSFDTENELSVAIENMVKEKGNTCVSIIVPTHRMGRDRQADSREVQSAILLAKSSIPNEEQEILSGIENLFEQIDFTRNKDGIGIFVSPHSKNLVRFPFDVTKKIIVDRLFHLHDLLYLENYSNAYYLLDISKKEIRLFRGVMDHSEEIEDNDFPMEMNDDYEYSKPGQSSSNAGYAHVKGFEKDKSEVRHIRLAKAYRQADRCLSKYLVRKEIPLLLCGTRRDMSLFKSVTNQLDHIAGLIINNQQHASKHDMDIAAWDQIKSFTDQQKSKLVDEFKEKLGAGLAVYGMEVVWKTAGEGKAFKMLVEKECRRNALITPERDTVNEIMNTVLEKNGKVVIVEKDALKDFKRIALLNRY